MRRQRTIRGKEKRVETFLVKIAETLVVEPAPSCRLLQAWFHVSLNYSRAIFTTQRSGRRRSEVHRGTTHEEGCRQ